MPQPRIELTSVQLHLIEGPSLRMLYQLSYRGLGKIFPNLILCFAEFDFDLWSSPADAVVKKVTSNEWLEAETKRHNLKNSGKIQRKLPEDHFRVTSKLPAVEVPHAGASYNPTLKDHQVGFLPGAHTLICLNNFVMITPLR